MSQKGQGLVEYALMLMIIATVVIIILALIGSDLCTAFNKLAGGSYCTPSPDSLDALYVLAGIWVFAGIVYGLDRLAARIRKK